MQGEGDDEHEHQEAGAAPGMERRELPAILRRQLQSAFVAMYGLVFSSVVLEHSLYLAHKGNSPHVQHEQQYPESAFREIEPENTVGKQLHQAHHTSRQYDENSDRECQRQHYRHIHEYIPRAFAPELVVQPFLEPGLFVFLIICFPQQLGRLHQLTCPHDKRADKSDDASYQRQLHPFLLLLYILCFHLYGPVGEPDCQSALGLAPHHYPFHHGLAAHFGGIDPFAKNLA